MKTFALLTVILMITFSIPDAPKTSNPHQRDTVLRCQTDHVTCTADCANWYFVNPICSAGCNEELQECYDQMP